MKRNTPELKEKLIQTGVEEIQKHGIDQLSLRTVARACGVTHGTPYKHFESKEGYLKVVLGRLSDSYNSAVTKNIDNFTTAREQLIQMGLNFVVFAQDNPYHFEALFIKYPFNYMKVTSETIITTTSLPRFDHFKDIVTRLRQEEQLISNETDTLIHFWSFISGLSVLIKSPIGDNFTQQDIQKIIEQMLNIYIKGSQR